MNRRIAVLSVLLAALSLGGLAHALHLRQLTAELRAVAEAKAVEFRAESEALGEPVPRIATAVVVSKSGLVYGAVSGKVSIYLQAAEHAEPGHIDGFEFMYARDASGWRQTESGHCSSEECTREGLRLLRRLDRH